MFPRGSGFNENRGRYNKQLGIDITGDESAEKREYLGGDVPVYNTRLCSNALSCAKERIALERVLIVHINMRRQNAPSTAVGSDCNMLGFCIVFVVVALLSVHRYRLLSIETTEKY